MSAPVTAMSAPVTAMSVPVTITLFHAFFKILFYTFAAPVNLFKPNEQKFLSEF